MSETPIPYAVDDAILTIRGLKVILDSDLARIYGVEAKRLNEQVKRNRERVPADFAFQLTPQEVTALRSQIATSNTAGMRSQFATASPKRNIRFMPYAFTEHGAIMVENVLLTHDSALQELYETIRPLLLPPPEPDRPRIGFGVHEPRARYRTRRT